MSREVKDVSITKLEDGRFRAAIAYHEGDQVADTEVESFATFQEATDFVIKREANPAAPPAHKEQTELGGRVDAPGESSTSVPHSADPSAQDSPVSQNPQDSPVAQPAATGLAQSNPADLQNEATAHSDALAADNETAKAEQDAGTAN